MTIKTIFGLNNDGTQFHCGMRSMSGRDQGGRFVGQVENDEEIVEQGGSSVDLTHFPDFACTFFGVNIAVDTDLTDIDDEDDWRDNMDKLEWMSDDNEPLHAGDKYELKYRPLLPHLWADDEEYCFEEGLEYDEFEEPNYSFGPDNWEFFHPELFDDGDETVGCTFQSGISEMRENSSEVLHRPVGYDSTWRSLGELRDQVGRSHHSDKRPWWSAFAKQRRANRGFCQPEATIWHYHHGDNWNWFRDLIEEDIEDGHAVVETLRFDDYYENLLAINNINRELKDEWAKDWAEFETFAQNFWRKQPTFGFSEKDADLRLLHVAYYCGSYARSPELDRATGMYIHQNSNNNTSHGWHSYAEELMMDALAEPYLEDMDFRDAMNDGYGDPALADWRQPVQAEMTV